uniref:(northern house mosquito) hypothetical protein n=2 Tax=Culex pipiens TaxID=7175 RepID=A0A8D8GAQ9_CULPI
MSCRAPKKKVIKARKFDISRRCSLSLNFFQISTAKPAPPRYDGRNAQALLDGRPSHPDRGDVFDQLFLAGRRTAQQAGGRGAVQQGAAADAGGHFAQREGTRPDRNVGQLGPDQHRRQAGRRDREDPVPQVHPVHDDAGGELYHPAAETDRGLRH